MKNQKQQTSDYRERINPIMEYLAPLKGTITVNDPNLRL